jgi:hypothetical protein
MASVAAIVFATIRGCVLASFLSSSFNRNHPHFKTTKPFRWPESNTGWLLVVRIISRQVQPNVEHLMRTTYPACPSAAVICYGPPVRFAFFLRIITSCQEVQNRCCRKPSSSVHGRFICSKAGDILQRKINRSRVSLCYRSMLHPFPMGHGALNPTAAKSSSVNDGVNLRSSP